MQFVTGYPDGWKPAQFQQVAIVGVTRSYLRDRGMEFSSGEDELGQFDECVITVDGTPFIFQQYVKPLRSGFAIELPRSLLDDTPDVSSKLSALLAHLGIESEDLIWRHAGVDLQFPVQDKTEPPPVTKGGAVFQSRSAAVKAAARAAELVRTWREHQVLERPDWVGVYTRANKAEGPVVFPYDPLVNRPSWLVSDPSFGHRTRHTSDLAVWSALHELIRAYEVQHDPAYVTFHVHDSEEDEDEPVTEKVTAVPAKRTRTAARRGGKPTKRPG